MNLTQAQIDLVKNRVFAATDKDAARQMNISEKAFKGRKERALIAARCNSFVELAYRAGKLNIV